MTSHSAAQPETRLDLSFLSPKSVQQLYYSIGQPRSRSAIQCNLIGESRSPLRDSG